VLCQTRAAKGFAVLSLTFFILIIPIERLAARETSLVGHKGVPLPETSSLQDSTLAPSIQEFPRGNNFGEEARSKIDNMRLWLPTIDFYAYFGPMIYLGQPHPV
jgi:hypothetical protein